MPLLSLRSLPGAAVPEWPLTAGLGDEEGPPEAEGAHPPAKAAVVVITSGTCATSRGRGDGALRGLNIGECDRYAHERGAGRSYIGANYEGGEFAGCVLWEGKVVEFNSAEERGLPCDLSTKRGACLCIEPSS
eukprot:1897132-Prymnesium_polylepis.1